MRLIDADKLKEEMIVLFNLYGEETPTDYVLNELERAPTIERPHGEWIEKSKFDRLCKNCGQQHIGDKRFANFCPNCGSDNRPRENNSYSMIINGKYSENVEYGTRIEIGEMKEGGTNE